MLRDAILLGLVALSSPVSATGRIGGPLNRHQARQAQISNSTTTTATTSSSTSPSAESGSIPGSSGLGDGSRVEVPGYGGPAIEPPPIVSSDPSPASSSAAPATDAGGTGGGEVAASLPPTGDYGDGVEGPGGQSGVIPSRESTTLLTSTLSGAAVPCPNATTYTYVDPNGTVTYTKTSIPLSCNATRIYTRPGGRPTSVTTEADDTAKGTDAPVSSEETDTVSTMPNGDTCTQLEEGAISTVYSVIFTETITFTGNPSDYVAPYPSTPVPTFCATPLARPPAALSPNRETTVFCETYKDGTSTCVTEPVFKPTFIYTIDSPKAGQGGGGSSKIDNAEPNYAPVTKTFYVTEKNPSVVYVDPIKTPGYTPDPDENIFGNPDGRVTQGQPPGGSSPKQSMKMDPPQYGYTITAGPNAVIINSQTFGNIPPAATTTVTVDGGVFEINPTQIRQLPGGQTVSRPAPGGGLYVPTPTSTNVGGMDVSVSGSIAVIGGYTYTIGNTPSTEVIKGQTVVIGPTGIDFKGSGTTIPFTAVSPEQTEIVVAGGDMLTAIGQSILVLHSTTITYGPGISPRTEVVDDDTIIIGPAGVTVHGVTLGGSTAKPGATKYEIVGGATITQIGQSKAVIGGTTYTVGPGAGKTTTVVGGETVTIGPEGVVVGTLTLPYPFGPTVVTTLRPLPTATAPTPAVTGEPEEDSGILHNPQSGWVIIGFCIAIGAWVLDITI